MDKFLPQLLDALGVLLVGLVPGAVGASCWLLIDRTLTWAQRFGQIAVGIAVSFFIGRAIGAVWAMPPMALDAIKFVLGLIAFKATPGFVSAMVDVVAGLPAQLRDRYFPKGPSE